MRRRTTAGRWGLAISTAVIAIFVLAPIYWMVATSFKTPAAVSAAPPQLFPSPASVENYLIAFVDHGFGRYILNSVIVSVAATALVLVLGTLAGYALARLGMRATFTIMVLLLVLSVFPLIALIAPLYLLMRTVGWLNSYEALIIPYTALNLPFGIWILRNYFLGVPKEVEENARLDGASAMRTLWSVVLPMALPGLFTAGIFAFTACWTEFLMALSFNSADEFRTIPVGIALFGNAHVTPYGAIFAASAVAVVPIAILVLVFRRSVVSGLTSGAVKG
ncbi:carbohydrate ABC transporter permease [Microbacterium protaetiae]|uniref:Carbohydrate ABC transporter permease n=1 Tax=Microbacterium protaetiae TaxID=2509458 RepID=A0A4P6EBK2_9MICO|nr:carbohydrate ABC transporter permease [Microbacterium protaetiae]QAY59354.1 carbohydrate ABC transporter permease [Microbacterium protaetiae]